MAKRMSERQWQAAREAWEADPREGYAWLVRELELSVSRVAVSRRAAREGWSKKEGAEVTPSETPKLRKVTPSVTSVTPPPGRPTDYRPEFADMAYRLALLGLTREQMATAFDVCERTIYHWQQEHPEFLQAIARGGIHADAEVAEALFNRARGAVVPDVHIALHEGQAVITPLEKHYPPDVGAARLWLKNRTPEQWKDKVELVEKPTIALVDREAMAVVYDRILAEAEETREQMRDRRERLGLLLDSERGGAVRDDEVIIARDEGIEGGA